MLDRRTRGLFRQRRWTKVKSVGFLRINMIENVSQSFPLDLNVIWKGRVLTLLVDIRSDFPSSIYAHKRYAISPSICFSFSRFVVRSLSVCIIFLRLEREVIDAVECLCQWREEYVSIFPHSFQLHRMISNAMATSTESFCSLSGYRWEVLRHDRPIVRFNFASDKHVPWMIEIN